MRASHYQATYVTFFCRPRHEIFLSICSFAEKILPSPREYQFEHICSASSTAKLYACMSLSLYRLSILVRIYVQMSIPMYDIDLTVCMSYIFYVITFNGRMGITTDNYISYLIPPPGMFLNIHSTNKEEEPHQQGIRNTPGVNRLHKDCHISTV